MGNFTDTYYGGMPPEEMKDIERLEREEEKRVRREQQKEIRGFLKTFRLVPEDIFLATMMHDFDMSDHKRCVCGWAVREAIARIQNVDATKILDIDASSNGTASMLFGGTYSEWSNIFHGVTDYNTLPLIETAIVRRLDEILKK